MNVDTAVKLINAQVVYKPGWRIIATDYRARHEHALCVRVQYPALDHRRAEAPQYSMAILATASFIIDASTCADDVALYRALLEHLLSIETHEAREALRIRPTFWGPFNPHTTGGRHRWGQPERDLAFGTL